jgi:hypothetical protein|eukprot:scaffold13194_cov195-Alexandrium_tamarense.AAC.3
MKSNGVSAKGSYEHEHTNTGGNYVQNKMMQQLASHLASRRSCSRLSKKAESLRSLIIANGALIIPISDAK